MKNTYIIAGVVVVVAVLAFVFLKKDNDSKVDVQNNENMTAGTVLTDGAYTIDTANSRVEFTGEYTNGAVEGGSLAIAEGSFMVASGQPFVGTISFDIKGLTIPGNLVLENYLKGLAILDADAYPAASFVVGKVLPNPVSGTTTGKYIIEGKLTLKDQTVSVSFPMTFSQTGNTIVGDSSFALNRAEWGFDANPEIRNAVLVNVHIEAHK